MANHLWVRSWKTPKGVWQHAVEVAKGVWVMVDRDVTRQEHAQLVRMYRRGEITETNNGRPVPFGLDVEMSR